MHIAILTFDGFNELDSLIAFGILNRVQHPDWRVSIAAPSAQIRSMNGLLLERQIELEDVRFADAVLIGSGNQTRLIAGDEQMLARLQLDATRQLIGAQCSGALLLSRLGLLKSMPVCTDLTTRPWVIEEGVQVLDQPFYARGNLASAGGCLASAYLAAWVIGSLRGSEEARSAIHYVAPVGEKDEYVERTMQNVLPFLD